MCSTATATKATATKATTVAAWAVAVGLGCGAALEGRAAPPGAHDGSLSPRQTAHVAPSSAPRALLSAGADHSSRERADHASQEGMGQLDLRLPDTFTATLARSRGSGQAPRDLDEGSYQGRVAALAGPNLQMVSRLQSLAQRVQREGVPFARLFESRSALVSLGLNQRGKPGLWLIQKTH